jgi:hypothetical protein
LNFKFLSSLDSADAGQFFQDLLWKLGGASNDDQFDPVIDHIFDWQVKAYTGKPRWTYEDKPFTPLSKPVSQTTMGLLTSSGHFVEGDDPQPFGVENMSQKEAEERIGEFIKSPPQLSTIPIDIPKEKLRVRHGGYDTRAAKLNPNCVLPIDRMKEMADSGQIGNFHLQVYSFVGATAQTPLIKETAPAWAEMLQAESVEGVVLVPV